MRESTFLSHLYATEPPQRDGVVIGPGDDMALLVAGGDRVLAAIDAVVEGRHFRRGTDLRLVGRKAVLRNLSDVAAMAARPLACLAAVQVPAGFGDADAQRLLEGLREAGDAHDCPLVGGDTAVHADPSAPLTVSVAILAAPALPSGRVITRSGAEIGDRVFVTGTLGGSLAADGGGRHLDFPPRIREANQLARTLGDDLHAMIDLSDGLGIDAGHLAAAADGDLAIEIDAAALPCTPGCSWRQAMGDGEDFELCFCAASPPPARFGDLVVSEVGRVVERRGGPRVRVVTPEGVVDGSSLGYEHRADDPRGGNG